MKAWHFLREDMTAGNGNEPAWTVGETRSLPDDREIIPCEYGYHASPTAWDALEYTPGPVLCLVEIDGDLHEHGSPVNKYAARSRTLIAAINVSRELREFAADCAERALFRFEELYPDDNRPRRAIEVAREYARGAATDDELESARSAAESAAWVAARSAAIGWQRQQFEQRFAHLFSEFM